MGRRSINTTKSGKFMNPTDQARKEARKRELKKNKKQRMAVRHAVLKGKDPLKLLEDMELIDKMEYDPTKPPKLNEKVLKDKRKKLKETFERVFGLYEKEDPEYAMELRKAENSYEKKRSEMQAYYDQVKMAEQVQLDQIPLPDGPSIQPLPSQIPLPSDFPDLGLSQKPVHGILKRPHTGSHLPPGPPPGPPPGAPKMMRKPPGPPPGPPPELSESEDEEEMMDTTNSVSLVDVPLPEPSHKSDEESDDEDRPPQAKSRKIRFEDDASYDPSAPEKDSRPKFKPAVSALQVKMLQMAGQEIPMVDTEKRRDAAKKKREQDALRKLEELQAQTKASARSSLPAPPGTETLPEKDSKEDKQDKEKEAVPSSEGPMSNQSIVPPGPPPGLPPGLPPGPPPGLPPMMFRPPPLRGAAPNNPPQGLPPGPPPGRPPGMPPGPPPGLPPSVRPRLPPGPPGVPPPRLIRPPGGPPPGIPPSSAPRGVVNPNVLSAPPSIMKPPTKMGSRGMGGGAGDEDDSKKTGATIEAKPRIKNLLGDVTRFMPTALRVKRLGKDAKGKTTGKTPAGKDDTAPAVKQTTQVAGQTKDDAYDAFMREMEGFL